MCTNKLLVSIKSIKLNIFLYTGKFKLFNNIRKLIYIRGVILSSEYNII